MLYIMNTNFNENNEIHHLLSAYIGQGSSQVALVVKNLSANVGNVSSNRVGKIFWRRVWKPTSVFLLGESHDRGAWWATVRGVAESWTQLSDLAPIQWSVLTISQGITSLDLSN